MMGIHLQIASSNPFKPSTGNEHSIVQTVDAIDDASIHYLELESMLSVNIEDGQDFEQAVRSATAQTNDEFLFSFPSDRFPVNCERAACIRLHDEMEDQDAYLYLYQCGKGSKIKIADQSLLDEGLRDFARSFTGVMEQLRDFAPNATKPANPTD